MRGRFPGGSFYLFKVKGRSIAEDAGEVSNDEIVVKIDPDLKDLIPGYLQNRRNDIVNIKAALETKDFEFIQRQGHSMKGPGAGYGFAPVSTLRGHRGIWKNRKC